MVPTCSRWRFAMPRSGTRYTPSSSRTHAVVLGVGVQARRRRARRSRAPSRTPSRVSVAVGVARCALRRTARRRETAAERDADQVLHQHVERLVGRDALLDAPGLRRAARRRRLDEFERVGRHQRDAAGAPGRVAAAAGALQQPRHALGRADLQHALDRQEVDAEVERRGGDHRLQRALPSGPASTQSRTSLVERAVVQRDRCRPSRAARCSSNWYQISACERTLVKTSVVPRASRSRRPPAASICAPRWPAHEKRPGSLRQQRVDDELLVDAALHQHGPAGSSPGTTAASASPRPDCRASPQAPHRRAAGSSAAAAPARAAPARRACCPSARATRRRPPCARRQVARAHLARQHQRQRLGRGDQRARQLAILPRAFGGSACRRCAGRRSSAAPARAAAAPARASCRPPARASASARALCSRCALRPVVPTRASAPIHTA